MILRTRDREHVNLRAPIASQSHCNMMGGLFTAPINSGNSLTSPAHKAQEILAGTGHIAIHRGVKARRPSGTARQSQPCRIRPRVGVCAGVAVKLDRIVPVHRQCKRETHVANFAVNHRLGHRLPSCARRNRD